MVNGKTPDEGTSKSEDTSKNEDTSKKEVLAIIPARGGSKGLPRKNIRLLAGQPLIAFSIAAGLQAETVTRVIVSTDDEEIAAVARSLGAETPFLRPAEFARDQTTDLPVFQHALCWLAENEHYCPEIVVQLRPTSPVRPRDLVDRAVRLLRDHPEADSVRGVVPSGQNPHKMWRIDGSSGQMKPLLSVPGIAEPYNAPRQALPPTYWQTGHVDAIRSETILEKESMSGQVILPVMIDRIYTIDIDSLADLRRAERMISEGIDGRPLDMVWPGRARRPLPSRVDLLVLDFDGVLTDNRVWVDQDGREQVAAYRSDSIGINRLREAGVSVIVISTETNPVVAARCRKLNLDYLQAVDDKQAALRSLLPARGIAREHVVYLGNDLNDVPCFPEVACAVVVADAEEAARREADLVLTRTGGHGAVRELCELLLQKF